MCMLFSILLINELQMWAKIYLCSFLWKWDFTDNKHINKLIKLFFWVRRYSEFSLLKHTVPHRFCRSVPQSTKGLGVTRWAGPQRSEVNSQPDRRMEESGQHLKDETGVKDGPGLALWQSGIWMRPNTGVTKGPTITMEYFNCFFLCVWVLFSELEESQNNLMVEKPSIKDRYDLGVY